MTPRVVLFTRTSRPSGAQMAWRLFQAGLSPVAVIVEKRGRMLKGRKNSPLTLLSQMGADFIWRRLCESFSIRMHFYGRKLLGRHFQSPVYLSIEELALDHPFPLYEVEDHNGARARELLRSLKPDIGILTNTRRIQREILEIPRLGFLNLHLSALPKYAGLDSIFWALYHGEKEIGVTVHFAAEQIDRGDLVLQRKIPVSPFDDEQSLYEKALWLGTSLTVRAVKQVLEGLAERRPQNREEASYFSWPKPAERKIFQRRRREKEELLRRDPSSGRVVHLITRMTRGGAQENTLATVQGLAGKGYQVSLITGSSWGPEGEILSGALERGLEITLVPALEREIRPLKDFGVFLTLCSLLRRCRPLILHTHTSKAGFLGRLVAFLLKIPVVIHTPHGHVFHSYFGWGKEKFFLFLERLAARRTDRLIALTTRCWQEHLELRVGTPAKWVTIPSGVNENEFQDCSSERAQILASFRIPSGRPMVGYFGRLARIKGARYLIEALPAIFQAVPESHCLIVGDGEEREGLEKRVCELGLEGRVTFAGHQREVSKPMSVTDVLVVPSLNEGMGRVIVEGGFLAKAVVGTRVGGIPDLIEDGKTGLLVEPRNAGQLAGAVVRLLQDPEQARRLGAVLRAKVLNGFTEDQMVEKIRTLYQSALKEKGISVPNSTQPLESLPAQSAIS